jgi:hypothetical protein
MKDRTDSVTPIISSNRIYNTSLLSSIYLYRVLVRDPPVRSIYPISPEDESPWHVWSQVKEILIEAPTVIVAIMTARDVGYTVTHVECMHHD